jgi:hypothetical protein
MHENTCPRPPTRHPAPRLARALSTLTVLALTLPVLLAPSSSTALAATPLTFRDVAGTPHEAAIMRLASTGAISGHTDGTFRPGAKVTRGQLATMISRMLDEPIATASASTDRRTSVSFRDLRGSAHRPAIERLAALGIVGGYSDGTFQPERPVSRGQLATILERTVALLATPAVTVDKTDPQRFGPFCFSHQNGSLEQRDAIRTAYHRTDFAWEQLRSPSGSCFKVAIYPLTGAQGMYWPSSGLIGIHDQLSPSHAARIWLYEAAHAVDTGLLRDEHRDELYLLAHHGYVPQGHREQHPWFGRVAHHDQVGEAFMYAFVGAFTDLPESSSYGSHSVGPAGEVRRIVESAYRPVFNDVTASSPHRPAILRLVRYGVLHPQRDGRFLPNEAVTRGELATAATGALDYLGSRP